MAGRERLAFSRWLPGQGEQIFTMRPDGSDVRQLTSGHEGAESQHPAWSPDGSQICFASRHDGYGSLYLMGSDGWGPQDLTPRDACDDAFPAWSPDGREIAFSRGDHCGAEDLWIIDVASREERPLTTQGAMDYAPAWSPDGQRIAFRRSLADPAGIYVVGVRRGQLRFLVPGRSPSWRPDGGQLAYAEGGSILTVPFEGGRLRGESMRLTGASGASDDCPCWSPDGTWLAFERELEAGDITTAHIITMACDGRSCRDLGEGHTPHWSPRAVAQG